MPGPGGAISRIVSATGTKVEHDIADLNALRLRGEVVKAKVECKSHDARSRRRFIVEVDGAFSGEDETRLLWKLSLFMHRGCPRGLLARRTSLNHSHHDHSVVRQFFHVETRNNQAPPM